MIIGVIFLALCGLVITETPPHWPSQFTIDFNETSSVLNKGSTNGTLWYDTPNNRETIFRQHSRHDRYCGTIFAVGDFPCSHITTGGKFHPIKVKGGLISRPNSTVVIAVTVRTGVE